MAGTEKLTSFQNCSSSGECVAKLKSRCHLGVLKLSNLRHSNLNVTTIKNVALLGNVEITVTKPHKMEQHTLKIVNNCLNTNIYSYLETSGGHSLNLYLNVVHFFNTSLNYKPVAA